MPYILGGRNQISFLPASIEDYVPSTDSVRAYDAFVNQLDIHSLGMELNPDHALVLKLQQETESIRVSQWSDLLLNQALLAEGEKLENPAAFVKSLNALVLDLAG